MPAFRPTLVNSTADDRQSKGELIRRLAARYPGGFDRGFVRGKLALDPVVPALLARAPLGQVLDLGCGRGQLGLFLLAAGAAESVHGIDIDRRKIALARAASEGFAAVFQAGDLAVVNLPPAETVLLIDVLLQMSFAAQDRLLGEIVARRPRRVFIRAFDPAAGWRARCGLVMERLRRHLGGDLGRGGHLAPRPLAEIMAPFATTGYKLQYYPCWGRTPFPNVLIAAERMV